MAYDKEKTLEILKPYFQRGWSVTKVCDKSGYCDDQTILNWMEDDLEIRAKIKVWQNEITEVAVENWKQKINEGDYIASKDWLERKAKDDFSTRTETTGADGKDLFSNIDIIYEDPNQTEVIPETNSSDQAPQ
jgi:hypothetical protein